MEEIKKGKSILANAHESAFKAAKKKLPPTDVNKLIRLVSLLMNNKTKEAEKLAKEIWNDYQPAVEIYIKKLSEKSMSELMKNGKHEIFRKLDEKGFAHVLVCASPKIFDVLKAYFKHEISNQTLLEKLGAIGIRDIGAKLVGSNGGATSAIAANPNIVNSSIVSPSITNLGVINPNIFGMVGGSIVCYQASLAVYLEYRKAMDDFELAKEERLRTEAICAETVACIKEYRQLMEERVNEYLNLRLDIISDGFAAMDKAIIENDVDGYIAGNVEIQKMLGYEVQFTNQAEFDALMDSDEDFKL